MTWLQLYGYVVSNVVNLIDPTGWVVERSTTLPEKRAIPRGGANVGGETNCLINLELDCTCDCLSETISSALGNKDCYPIYTITTTAQIIIREDSDPWWKAPGLVSDQTVAATFASTGSVAARVNAVRQHELVHQSDCQKLHKLLVSYAKGYEKKGKKYNTKKNCILIEKEFHFSELVQIRDREKQNMANHATVSFDTRYGRTPPSPDIRSIK